MRVLWPSVDVIVDMTTGTLVLLELLDCAVWLDVDLIVDDVVEGGAWLDIELEEDVIVEDVKLLDAAADLEELIETLVLLLELVDCTFCLDVEVEEGVVVEDLIVLDAAFDGEELPPDLSVPAMTGRASSENLSVEVSQQPGFGGFWSLASGRFASQQ